MHRRALNLGAAAAASLALALTTAVSLAASAQAAVTPQNVTLTQVSSDPYTDSQAQHATEVEPDDFSFGSTVVSAFQVGRVSGGGASNIGWSTSADGGTTWTHGFLPDTTANTGGPYTAASDASVAYDADHGQWIISWLGLLPSGNVDVLVSRSSNGGTTWGNPIMVATGAFYDKNWTVCDNHPASAFYGNCYTEFDTASSSDREDMSTSSDGGATWGALKHPADNPSGLGGQPLVQPNGTVVVPFSSATSNQVRSFTSTNGGSSWTSSVLISTTSNHAVAGLDDKKNAKAVAAPAALRESVLPSAEIDASGKVYVSWADCRFRSGCSGNDIVLSTSATGATWTSPVQVPIDAVTSGADHFAPGLGVDASSSGGTARIGLTYYYYPTAKCTSSTCQLDVGYISSTTGGSTWSAPTQLAGPMKTTWLPNTSQGRMFGDYISTTVLAGGNAVSVFPVASAPTGSTFAMAMFAPPGGLAVTG